MVPTAWGRVIVFPVAGSPVTAGLVPGGMAMAAAGGVLGPSRWEASRALLLIASVKSKIREQESAGRGPNAMSCSLAQLVDPSQCKI